jgi:EF hand domain-containing protein
MLDGGPVHVRLNLALAGISLPEARRQFVARLIESLDKDKDGKLSRAEAAASPLLRKKERPGADKFLEGLGAQTHLFPRDVERKVSSIGGGPIGFREDLTSSKNDVEVFKLLDADGSGVLDTAELAAARDLIVGKDTDDDDCVSFEEFFPPPPPPTDPIAAANAQLNAAPPPLATATHEIVRSASDPTLPRRLRIKYDRNKDLQLDAGELGWSAERIKELDANLNGKLDEKELKGLGAATPDLDLAVDLKSKDKDGGVVDVQATSGRRLDDAGRLDFVKLAFSGAIVTFSMRNADPIASAVDDAMRQFNALDADANGYLDKDETSMRLRFQQGLFEMLDADGDEKVFVDEMKAYVKAFAEPSATTCRMNLYDTGYGFFMALDANADGRVSKRERNQASAALAQLERDGQPGVGQTEPVRHFHVEFVRGTRHLFGASEELVAQSPAFQQRLPTGPIWFQRMDKNNDGDLVWNEFFGAKETFHELDKDKDDLLDPQEAAAYPMPDTSNAPETTNTSASR